MTRIAKRFGVVLPALCTAVATSAPLLSHVDGGRARLVAVGCWVAAGTAGVLAVFVALVLLVVHRARLAADVEPVPETTADRIAAGIQPAEPGVGVNARSRPSRKASHAARSFVMSNRT